MLHNSPNNYETINIYDTRDKRFLHVEKGFHPIRQHDMVSIRPSIPQGERKHRFAAGRFTP